MNKRNMIIVAVVVAVAAGAAWAYFRGDPVVAEMQQLRDQMMELPEAQRREQWDNFRQRMDTLTDQQRQAVWESGRARFERFGRERMDEFFQLPPQEQKQRLDEIIDRMVERWQNPNRGGGPGGGPGGPRGGFGGPGGGGRGGWGSMSDAQRDQRRKEMISRTDPQMRAGFDQFRQMLGSRMKERGISPPAGGRGPWGG